MTIISLPLPPVLSATKLATRPWQLSNIIAEHHRQRTERMEIKILLQMPLHGTLSVIGFGQRFRHQGLNIPSWVTRQFRHRKRGNTRPGMKIESQMKLQAKHMDWSSSNTNSLRILPNRNRNLQQNFLLFYANPVLVSFGGDKKKLLKNENVVEFVCVLSMQCGDGGLMALPRLPSC